MTMSADVAEVPQLLLVLWGRVVSGESKVPVVDLGGQGGGGGGGGKGGRLCLNFFHLTMYLSAIEKHT